MADDRTYIRVHDGMDEHPKIEDLSDGAFRLLFRSWFYCSRLLTDGQMADKALRKRGTAKARQELIDAGLVHLPGHDCPHPACAQPEEGFVMLHDYLDHQRSADEVALFKAKKGKSGGLGNHIRWHVNQGKFDPDCQHCGVADGVADESHMRSQTDRETSPTTETETDKKKTSSSSAPKRPRRIPEDFAPTEHLMSWGRSKGFTDGQLATITEKFTLHWQAAGGRTASKLDWGKAWQTWVMGENPARVPETTASGSALPQQTLTRQEIDNLIGPDYRSTPRPPDDVVDVLAWHREQAELRNAERLRLALARKAGLQ